MSTNRLEAFTDAVLAIVLTIMVLELHFPGHQHDWAALGEFLPDLSPYVLSFVYIGIYWNNHHHLLQLAERVNGAVLWANLHLLFWLSLVPVTTSWLRDSGAAKVPTIVYGVVLLLAGFAYNLLQWTLIRCQHEESGLAQAVGRDWKGKTSVVLYVLGVLVSFVNPWLGIAAYTVVALMWFVPDRRLEAAVTHA